MIRTSFALSLVRGDDHFLIRGEKDAGNYIGLRERIIVDRRGCLVEVRIIYVCQSCISGVSGTGFVAVSGVNVAVFRRYMCDFDLKKIHKLLLTSIVFSIQL